MFLDSYFVLHTGKIFLYVFVLLCLRLQPMSGDIYAHLLCCFYLLLFCLCYVSLGGGIHCSEVDFHLNPPHYLSPCCRREGGKCLIRGNCKVQMRKKKKEKF